MGADWGEPSSLEGGEEERIGATQLSPSPQPNILGGTQPKIDQLFPKMVGPPPPSSINITHQEPPTTTGGQEEVKSNCSFKRGVCQLHECQGTRNVEKYKKWGKLKHNTFGWIHTSKVVWTCSRNLDRSPNFKTIFDQSPPGYTKFCQVEGEILPGIDRLATGVGD